MIALLNVRCPASANFYFRFACLLMNIHQFSLVKLEVRSSTDITIRKRLSPGSFVFDNSALNGVMNDFWGKNISIHAIVGKNGSGKSTLFDIILILINNLSYYVLKDSWNNGNTLPLKYVQEMCGCLIFRIGKTEGKIDCFGDCLKFEFGDKKYAWGFEDCNMASECMKGFQLMNHKMVDEDILDITRNFFYTIVINYSPHAYLESNYGNQFQIPFTYREWIASLFHKNDGYKAPLTITPYRDRGVLDMQRENYLNRVRLAALLIYYQKRGERLISDYQLNRIEYIFDPHRLIDKFDIKNFVRDPEEYEQIKNDIDQRRNYVLTAFENILSNKNSIAFDILSCFDIKHSSNDDEILLTAYLYLVYKVVSTAGTYPSLKEWAGLGNNMMNVFNGYSMTMNDVGGWKREDTKALCQNLKQNSHITLKIRQTIGFIKVWRYLSEAEKHEFKTRAFDYRNYAQHVGTPSELDDIMEKLPPPFFNPTIYMNLIDGGNEWCVDLSEISAGQLQFVHTMSNIVYHIENLLSVKEDKRVKYRYVNIMMDEIEMCYHPEYQRTFVNEIVGMIKRLRINERCAVNILMSTHSPFVLSDIPQSNVLYIDKGKDVGCEMGINTFAANVNELLNKSFFLSNGFMGEFAKEKIESLVAYLSNKDCNDGYWSEKKAFDIINLVGDDVVRYQLKKLYHKRFGDNNCYRNWIVQEANRLGIKL